MTSFQLLARLDATTPVYGVCVLQAVLLRAMRLAQFAMPAFDECGASVLIVSDVAGVAQENLLRFADLDVAVPIAILVVYSTVAEESVGC